MILPKDQMAGAVELVGCCVGLIHGRRLGDALDYVLALTFCIAVHPLRFGVSPDDSTRPQLQL